MVLKITGKKWKKVIFERIRLWFKRITGFIIWTVVMVTLLGLTVVAFTLLTTVCDNIV